MTGSSKPLGLFGGRFDPVHRAHIKVAQKVADQLNLDEIRWIPCGNPSHKPAIASASHRLRMVELALNELHDSRMRIDDREIVSSYTGQPSYTSTTIESFQHEFPNRELIWILGEDQLSAITTWNRWDYLIRSVSFAVYRRGDARKNDYAWSIGESDTKIYWITAPKDILSSTWIRDQLLLGADVTSAIPESVAHYIEENALYK